MADKWCLYKCLASLPEVFLKTCVAHQLLCITLGSVADILGHVFISFQNLIL